MGKSQSKLSPEQLADLQKNTYCTHIPQTTTTERSHTPSRQERTTAMVSSFRTAPAIAHPPLGTRASSGTVRPVSSTGPSSAAYTSSSSRSVTPASSQTMCSTSLTRTRTARSTLRSSSAPSASQAAAAWTRSSSVCPLRPDGPDLILHRGIPAL